MKKSRIGGAGRILYLMKKKADMKAHLRNLPLFLLFIPVFFLLHNNNYYYGLLDWSLLLADILIFITAPVPIYLLFGFLFKSNEKAGVLCFFLLLIFYFFQPFHEFIHSIPGIAFLGRYSILLPILSVMMLMLIIYLSKSKKDFRTFFRFVNILFLLLLCFEVITFFNYYYTGERDRNDLTYPLRKVSESYRRCDSCIRPDIYFFIFDEYANAKTLAAEFNYSNEPLNRYLKEKGFYIVEDSKSNYNFTHMSLASELNMNYLVNLDTKKTFYTKEFLLGNETILNNDFTRILKQEGYSIHNYSIFDIAGDPTAVTPYLQELHFRSVFGQTFPWKLKRDIGWNMTTSRRRPAGLNRAEKKIVEQDIRRLNETMRGVIRSANSKADKPALTYAHFLMPHSPYYFQSNGMRLNEAYSYFTLDNKKDYINQLRYTNRFIIMPLIDSIFRSAHRPFLIVLQSDHGFRAFPPAKVMLEMENLSAFYFYDGNYKHLYQTMSSVNTFRVILNTYFNQQLPLLKDSCINLLKHHVITD